MQVITQASAGISNQVQCKEKEKENRHIRLLGRVEYALQIELACRAQDLRFVFWFDEYVMHVGWFSWIWSGKESSLLNFSVIYMSQCGILLKS